MSGPPKLPHEVSANGAELWDWAGKLAEWTQRRDRIRTLEASIRNISNKCGSCREWMARTCPREKNVGGRNQGPSMNAPICGRFQMKPSSTELQAQWKAELARIEARSGETGTGSIPEGDESRNSSKSESPT